MHETDNAQSLNTRSAELVAWLRGQRRGNLRLHYVSLAMFGVSAPLIAWSAFTVGLMIALPILAICLWVVVSALIERNRASRHSAAIRSMAIRNLLERGMLLQMHEARTPGDMFGPQTGIALAYEAARQQDLLRDTRARLACLLEQYPLICRSRGWSWKPGQDDNEQLPEELRLEGADWRKVLAASRRMYSSMNSAERLVLIDSLIGILEGRSDNSVDAEGAADE